MTGMRSYISGMSLVLLAISVALGALFYLQWHKDIAEAYGYADSTSEKAAGEYELASVPGFQPIPYASLSEINERPLFSEGRIPPEKPDNNPQSAPRAAPLKLKLEGVVISPESKVAIITDLQTRELLRLSQGMSHRDWKVKAVSEGSVTIQQGEKEITLLLELDEGSAPAGGKPKVPFRLPVNPGVRR